jgi:hypothetical protein
MHVKEGDFMSIDIYAYTKAGPLHKLNKTKKDIENRQDIDFCLK